jgi:hypothetical protein
MAKNRLVLQDYPRLAKRSDKYFAFVDESALVPHTHVISESELNKAIREGIEYANDKSGRTILEIPDNASVAEKKNILKQKGKELFQYFQKYCGDPASTAFACEGRHYRLVAEEQFRNRTLQKERMNSGWRYQYIAKDAAILSKRFVSVSDIGAAEADFNAVIRRKNSRRTVAIYVSVKNRSNTMGGQDWPKAIRALEYVAQRDKNRAAPYLCVFGIVMDKGGRIIKREAKSGTPYSMNTEVWYSDFFWPFFANQSYEEIMKAVLSVLREVGETSTLNVDIPRELIEVFGEWCKTYQLLDNQGNFNDAERLVDFFCGKLRT